MIPRTPAAVGLPSTAAATTSGTGMRSSASLAGGAACDFRSSGRTSSPLSIDSTRIMASCPTLSATARSG